MGVRTPAWGMGVVSALACALLVMPSRRVDAATIVVRAGGDLQQAIDAAQDGDVILLEPGASYVGNFILRNKPGVTRPITIRSAASDAQLPGPGVRMTPAYAPLLPKIRSQNAVSALRTAAGAHHWTLRFLEFQANYYGYGEIISLGAGDATQSSLSAVPHTIILDRVYVHGDPLIGQKRGIALHSRDTQIINSYISDCKQVGQDSQAISGFNGPGGYLIENNYLEGAGENFMLGGADPVIPDLVTSDVIVRGNHLRKPLAWRDPIVSPVANLSAAALPGGGILPAGTYSYKVAARRITAQKVKATSAVPVEVSATTGNGGAVVLSWSPVPDADDYVIYGRAAGAQAMYWVTSTPSFVDTGAGGTAGAPPKPTRWVAKNLFELKNAQDVLIEGNVMENNWLGDQPGYAVVFTPRNQDGRAPWVVVQRVTFRYNLVRHTAGGVNILGWDNLSPSRQTNTILVEHNVFDDVTSATWGAGSKLFQLGDGVDGVTIDHNTAVATTPAILFLYGAPTTNAVFTNNMSRHNSYGIMGNGSSIGMASLAAYLPGGVVDRNVLAGGSASSYPAGNLFPSVASWQGQFADYASGDYRLLPSSPYTGAGTDGKDLGADFALVMAHAANALSGNAARAPAANPVQILTTTLPNGQVGQPYVQQLACSGSSVPCAWLLRDSSLPAGLAFDQAAAMVAGSPRQAGTGSITVEAYDPTWPGNAAVKTLSVTVDPPPLTLKIAGDAAGQVGQPFRLDGQVSGVLGQAAWSVASGQLPPGLYLDARGSVTGTPTTEGAATAVIRVWDSWSAGRTAERPVTFTIAAAPAIVSEVVLHAHKGTIVGSAWERVPDDSAAGGHRMWNRDRGAVKVAKPLTAPTSYVELAFDATPGLPYHVWLRGKADRNYWGNDSVFLQFSDAVDAAGQPIYRVGSSSAMTITIEDAVNAGLSGWGWQDGAFAAFDEPIRFATGGPHVVRIQVREDGMSIDQVVFSADAYFAQAPGALKNDTTILPEMDAPAAVAGKSAVVTEDLNEIVLYAADATVVAGTWQRVADGSAAGGARLSDPNAGAAKLSSPLAAPSNYFELSFDAMAHVPYHVWLRGKADGNSWANDSAFVQFTNTVDQAGQPTFRVGTTNAMTVTIEDALNAGLSGWGWQDGAFGALDAPIVFDTPGRQTIRIQVREDGLSIDQIVLSAGQYLVVSPGSVKNDSTILAK